MSDAAARGSGRMPEPERFLDLAARLVLSGRTPTVPRLARLYPCSAHFALMARSDLLARRLWPYRTRRGLALAGPTPGEVRAAGLRLGRPADDGPEFAGPATPAALACARFRREWRAGVNFLTGPGRPTDEED